MVSCCWTKKTKTELSWQKWRHGHQWQNYGKDFFFLFSSLFFVGKWVIYIKFLSVRNVAEWKSSLDDCRHEAEALGKPLPSCSWVGCKLLLFSHEWAPPLRLVCNELFATMTTAVCRGRRCKRERGACGHAHTRTLINPENVAVWNHVAYFLFNG